MYPDPLGRHAFARADDDSLMAIFDALDALNGLIEACKDGEFACEVAVEHAGTPVLRRALQGRADEYRLAADRLRAHVLHLGATPEDGGSTAGAMRRGWMAIRGRLASLDDPALLMDAEAEEKSTQAAFRETLARPLPLPTRGLVEQLQARATASAAPLRRLFESVRAVA